MRFLLPEAVRSVIARRAAGVALMFLSLLFIVAIAAIVQGGDAEREVLIQQLDSGVSRVVELQTSSGTPVLPDLFVATATSLSTVDYVVAVGRASDTVDPSSGQGPTPVRYVWGDAPGLAVPPCAQDLFTAVIVSNPASPTPTTGRSAAIQSPSGSQASIVNTTSLPPELEGRLTGALTRCRWPVATRSHELVVAYVVVKAIEDVTVTADALQSMVLNAGLDLRVVSATDLARYRAVVGSEISVQRRRAVMLAAISLVSLNLAVGVVTSVTRRNEFGRRRVLGATRLQLAGIAFLEGLVAGGVSLAVAFTGIILLQRGLALWIDLSWVPQVAAMVLSSAAIGQLPVVLAAGYMDPVRALRVP